MTRRPRRWRGLRSALLFLGSAALAATVSGHVRLRYEQNSAALYWDNPSNIRVVINSDGSDDISDGSHETAIRNAFAAWNAAGGTTGRLVEDASSSSQARRDWQNGDIHLVMFDENNSSGFFGGWSGTVAITPIWFFPSGRIDDADILFNGKDFRFTTAGRAGRFDVQDIASHEIGHFLGLDHSGVCGSTMYPYVDQTVILHRSLSLDDKRGMRHMYPSTAFARISGRVVRASDQSPVRGAHVVARDADGRLAGAILSDLNGNYTLESLTSGTYTVYADPLDQPVSPANIDGSYTIDTDFESTQLGVIAASVGSTASLGSRSVGADVQASLGRTSDNYPIRLIRGATRSIIVRGSHLVSGSTIQVSDPTLAVTNVLWFGSSVRIDVTVPAGSPLGHVDLTVTTPTAGSDVLVGGLEITPPNPIVTSVSPAQGVPGGGTLVTLSGQDFRAGSRVVIGDRIYRDGASGGCVVVDANTIRLSTAGTIAGLHDVVVIDPSGVEGRSIEAFRVSIPPTIAALFPVVGSTTGGTQVILSGVNFVPGSTVTIDGTVQLNVQVVSPTRLRVVTTAGVIGGPYILTVTSPGGDTADTAFAYVPQPDPVLASVAPRRGDVSGGMTVTVYGTGFDSSTRVNVGASALTGGGGTNVTTEFVSETALRIVMPAGSSGVKNVMVRNLSTGQASVLEFAFTYTGGQGGEEGGGCGSVLYPKPPTWRSVVGGSGWIVLLLFVAGLRGRRARALVTA